MYERPGTAAWEVIEPVLDSINIYEGPSTFLRGFERAPPAAGHLYAVHWCDSEVCNGGFHQFFYNSTGILAPEAVQGFRAVGLPECAGLLETAMRFFGQPYPRDRKVRIDLLAALGNTRPQSDPFFELDEQYFKLVKDDRLYKAEDEYARRVAR